MARAAREVLFPDTGLWRDGFCSKHHVITDDFPAAMDVCDSGQTLLRYTMFFCPSWDRERGVCARPATLVTEHSVPGCLNTWQALSEVKRPAQSQSDVFSKEPRIDSKLLHTPSPLTAAEPGAAMRQDSLGVGGWGSCPSD